MVTGAAVDCPGLGSHSKCTGFTDSVPGSFLYEACTGGRRFMAVTSRPRSSRRKMTIAGRRKATQIFGPRIDLAVDLNQCKERLAERSYKSTRYGS